MVGVYVYERAVKPNGAFVECDQRADVKCVDLWNAERDGIAFALVERRAGAAEKSLQVISARHAFLDLEFFRYAIPLHLDEGRKKIRHSITQLLDVRMLIGRALVAVNRDALVNHIAVEILFFA